MKIDEPKRSGVALRAREIYEKLMKLPRPDALSNNEWAKRAGVNTSFFTNLRNGSQPGVVNLEAVLRVVDISLPEFFLGNGVGQLTYLPSVQDLEGAMRAALPGLPRSPDRRAEYLAEVVLSVLALRPDWNTIPSNADRTALVDNVAA